MSTIFYRSQTGQEQASPSRRALSFALALAIEVLLLLALLTVDFRDKPRPEFKGGTIATFDVANVDSKAAASDARPVRAIRQVPHPKLPPVKPTITQRPLQMLEVTKDFLDAADIRKLGSNAPGAGKLADGRMPGDSEQVGTGPNGEPLYAAEWYREPTNQELATYMPKSLYQDGWGMIACKTAPRFKVEDCVELGQTPGSHLAGAVRQAAWQFLVRPPRIGGRSMVGEWVRIRIDYHVSNGESSGS